MEKMRIFLTVSWTHPYISISVLPRDNTYFRGDVAFRWQIGLC